MNARDRRGVDYWSRACSTATDGRDCQRLPTCTYLTTLYGNDVELMQHVRSSSDQHCIGGNMSLHAGGRGGGVPRS